MLKRKAKAPSLTGGHSRTRRRTGRSATSTRNDSRRKLARRATVSSKQNRPATPSRVGIAGCNGDNNRRQQASHAQLLAAVKSFENAIRYFHREKYQKAREIFEKLATSGPIEVADRARIHIHVCDQRLKECSSTPKTAVDFHVLGVAELNSRNLGMAVEHLGKACKLSPKSEDIRYALAAAYALEGNLDAALEHLRAAIELRPENRFQARQDKDFRSLMADPRFRSLVLAEVTQTVGMPKMQNRVTSQERLET